MHNRKGDQVRESDRRWLEKGGPGMAAPAHGRKGKRGAPQLEQRDKRDLVPAPKAR